MIKRSEHFIFDALTKRPSMVIIVESGVDGSVTIYSRPPTGGPETRRAQLATIDGRLAYQVEGE